MKPEQPKNNKEMQQKYMELSYMKQHLEEYTKQLQSMDSQIEEIGSIAESISAIAGRVAGTEILVPLANGIFMKAETKELDKLIVNVGNDVAVEKDPQSTINLLEEQKNQLIEAKIQMTSMVEEINSHIEEVEKELKSFVDTNKNTEDEE